MRDILGDGTNRLVESEGGLQGRVSVEDFVGGGIGNGWELDDKGRARVGADEVNKTKRLQ